VGLIEGLVFYVLFEDATGLRQTLFVTLGAVWLGVSADNHRSFKRVAASRAGAISFYGTVIAYLALVIALAKELDGGQDLFVSLQIAALLVALASGLGGRGLVGYLSRGS
jgi:hypothetical protein